MDRPCRAIAEEWTKLIKLKEQSLGRKIAAYEADMTQITEIFERIGKQARKQLVVRIFVIVLIFRV